MKPAIFATALVIGGLVVVFHERAAHAQADLTTGNLRGQIRDRKSVV